MEADPEPAVYFVAFIAEWLSAFQADNIMFLIGGIALLLLMLFISASFSASENAFFSIGPTEITTLQQMGEGKAQKVLALLQDPERSQAVKKLLATILIGNNFINIALVIWSSFLASEFIDLNNPVLAFVIEVVVITFMLVMFGEIIPKVYATQNKLSIALYMAPALSLCQRAMTPLVNGLVKTTFFLDKYSDQFQNSVSAADLSQAIELTSDKEGLEEKNILIGLVNFVQTTVREIMRTRMDVVAVDISMESDQVFELIRKNGYSRMPVYDGNFDQVVGILFMKDLIPYLRQNPETFKWQDLIRQPMCVPEFKKIDQLLKEFQSEHVHMAIVVDEYGGTLGIVTMEDILEEILGDIKDEYDEEDLQYSRLDDDTYVFEAKISLNDFSKILELDHDYFDEIKGDAESLGGVIQELEGRIPPRGTQLQIGKLKMVIESSDKRKINRVKISLAKQQEAND